MPGPLLVGLTGGIAAGKSEALRILGELGAATISADAIVHELLGEEHVGELIRARWGDRVVADGALDRAAIAGIVFADHEELEWLESILHPLVGERLREWDEGLGDSVEVAVAEIPLLFEGTTHSMFDATIAISAPDPVRVERASARGTGDLEGRDGRQLPQEEKAARATYAIDNEGSLDDLRKRLAQVYEELRARR